MIRKLRTLVLPLAVVLVTFAVLRIVFKTSEVQTSLSGAVGDNDLTAKLQQLAVDVQDLESHAESLARNGQQQANQAPFRAHQDGPSAAGQAQQGQAGGLNLALFRSDGRCGPNFPASGAPDFGQCDPHADADQKGPCCNPESGWCGNIRHASWGHCDCPTCIDYSKNLPDNGARAVAPAQHQPIQHPPIRNDPSEPKLQQPVQKQPAQGRQESKQLPMFREDGRCGPHFPAPGAPAFGQCDPKADADQKGPCCNPDSGWCGNIRNVDWGHCDCPNCVDYSKPPSQRRRDAVQAAPAAMSRCDVLFCYDRRTWDPINVCSPLFSKTDLSQHKDTRVSCWSAPDSQSVICQGQNVIVTPDGVEGACLPSMREEELDSKMSVGQARLLSSLVLQDSKVDLASGCSSWETRDVVIISRDPSTDPYAHAHALFQTLKAFDLIDQSHTLQPGILFLVADHLSTSDTSFQKLAPNAQHLDTLTGSLCAENVIFAGSGRGSPIFSYENMSDCTVFAGQCCNEFALFLDDSNTPSCPASAR